MNNKINDIKQEIIANVKISAYPQTPVGGQHTGRISTAIQLVSEEYDFNIIIGGHRSQQKNKELAITFFELYLDEIIK